MAQPAPAEPQADPDEARRQQQCAQRWIAEITASEKAQRRWLERARKIVRRYKKEDSDVVRDRRFAMLWSNTQTIQPAVYSRPPQPVVSRRFQDADPVGRVCSEVLERALSYSIDCQGLDGILRQCSLDYVLLARGQAWERYEPTFGAEVVPEIPLQVKTEGDEGYTDEDGNSYNPEDVKAKDDGTFYAEGEPYRPVEYEESVTDYVNWEDFGHSIARTWDEVSYVWRRVYLSRDQLIKRFGENLGKVIPLDWGPIEQGSRDESARVQKKAAVYEIWDKATKKAYWISKSWSSRPLDERDDPLELEGFFPCPKPLLGTMANDSVQPVPDYVYYQDQAEEIDALTARIAQLEKALKVRGFYAGDVKTNLNNLLNAENNTLIPVPEWQTLKEGGGLANKIDYFPTDQVAATLKACIELRAQLIQDVYQITGVADIMRGMGDPRATATQEQLKGQWGTLRVRDRQVEMMRFARDILRIKGNVIASKFSADTLRAMTGVQIPTAEEKAQAQAMYDQGAAQYQQAVQQAQMTGQPPPPQPEVPPELQKVLDSPTWEDVEALLQNNALRQFRIDIETDSTIEANEQEQKAQAMEFLSAMGGFIGQWGAAVQQQPALAPMAGEFIKWGARFFRIGRSMEETIDTAMEQVAKSLTAEKAQGAQAQAEPPPDRTAVEVQAMKNQQEQIKQAGENERAQLEAQVESADQNLRSQELQAKLYVLPRDPMPQVGV